MIIVFGSINMDMSLKLKSFPEEGETVLSSSYISAPGGKGANQALAAARIGAKTALVGKIGDDGPGLRILSNLKRNAVMTSGIAKSENLPTGMAFIMKDKSGENRIVVASGANSQVSADQAPAEILHRDNIVVLQMEVPIEQNAIVMKTARENGAKVILNMAPSLAIPKQMLSLVDYLIVNQIEARQLGARLKIDVEHDTSKLAAALAKEGNLTCIVTLGAEGVVCVSPDGKGYKIPSMNLGEKAVDASGAGDCFCGTFAACIHDGKTLETALRMATIASGLSCLKEGTQDSYPYVDDVKEVLKTFADVTPL